MTDEEDGAAPAAHGGSAADISTDSASWKEYDESEDRELVKEEVVQAMRAVACAKEAVVNANNALAGANNALKRMTFHLNIPPLGHSLFSDWNR